MPNGKKEKPKKPSKKYPLFAHSNGHRAKKIRGKLHYFGPLDNPKTARANHEEHHARVTLGEGPEVKGGLTLKELIVRFTLTQQGKLEREHIGRKTYTQYNMLSNLVGKMLGGDAIVDQLGPRDFSAARKRFPRYWSLNRNDRVISHTTPLFKYAFDHKLIQR